MVNTSVVAELCIYIFTWNVGSHNPKNTSLSDALSLNGTSNCPHNKLPDIYVLGFQKVTSNWLENDNKWNIRIIDELLIYGYAPVKTTRMQGLLINVWAKEKLVDHIQNIETEETGTDLLGQLGDKGAVSVRFSLYGTGVAFIVAHLPGHDEKLDDRVRAYKQIVKNHHYKSSGYRDIFDHAVVVWFGDLNFRLQNTPFDVHDEIKHNRLSGSFAFDQLTAARKNGEAFELMDESHPTFPPTFKFIEGTSEFDLKQIPAWCDRILYKVNETKYSNRELKLQQLSYNSHPEYRLSAHKPVTAEFLYTIKDTATLATET